MRHLEPGTYGKITRKQETNGQWRARARYCDPDGRVRLVERVGVSGAAAERDLKAALRDRRDAGGGAAITAETRIADLADAWLAADHDWATGTRALYTGMVRNEVKPALGGIRLRQADPVTLGRALAAIRDSHGPGAAKTTKAVLSGMFKHAIGCRAITTNPVRDVTVKLTKPKAMPRALTRPTAADPDIVDELAQLTDWLRTDPRAVALDLPDLVDWMLATGCRIGEACAARYGVNALGQPLLDLDAGTWEIDATVKRVAGAGLVLSKTKSPAGHRLITLPSYAVAMLRRRQSELRREHKTLHLVFPSPFARNFRDPSNTQRALRDALDRADFGWAKSHTFRKSALTWLLDAGLPPHEVAAFAGHAQTAMTLNVYAGRPVTSTAAATVLDR